MVITGTSIVALGVAIGAGVGAGFIMYGLCSLLFWGSEGRSLFVFAAIMLVTIALAAWGGWELVYLLTARTIQLRTGS